MAPIAADASPEKRLFISLLTRDIALTDAFLDLIDNSVNSVLAKFAAQLKSAADYRNLLAKAPKKSLPKISLTLSDKDVCVADNSSGIHWVSAKDHVFKFGRVIGERDKNDRLSVYGVGLKRAIFKMGNKIEMVSNHAQGGFRLSLNVSKWEKSKEPRWTIPIDQLPSVESTKTGTSIKITELYPDVLHRMKDGLFISELKAKIRRTYTFFIGRLLDIELNGEILQSYNLEIGENTATDEFDEGGVTCSISAGIGQPDARGNFVTENAGWSIFCNGRTLVYADKSELTGWTGTPQLPLFQPKHRPFMGMVFFVSQDPEALPWTTTKAAINLESGVWQEARRRMIAVGKEVTSVLDKRYSNDGTELTKEDVRALSGKPVPALSITGTSTRRFALPKKAPPTTMRIQYDADIAQVEHITEFLRKPNMSGSEVGRHTFNYFLRNRAGYDE